MAQNKGKIITSTTPELEEVDPEKVVQFGQVRIMNGTFGGGWGENLGKKFMVLEPVAPPDSDKAIHLPSGFNQIAQDVTKPSHWIQWRDGKREIQTDRWIKMKSKIAKDQTWEEEDERPRQLRNR